MQDSSGDGDFHGTVRYDLGLAPTFLSAPIDLEHMVSECLAECVILRPSWFTFGQLSPCDNSVISIE